MQSRVRNNPGLGFDSQMQSSQGDKSPSQGDKSLCQEVGHKHWRAWPNVTRPRNDKMQLSLALNQPKSDGTEVQKQSAEATVEIAVEVSPRSLQIGKILNQC